MLEKTIILDGFSKTYSMTGWRLGYGVMPEWLAEAVVKLMVNSNSCTASFTQRAGIEALEGPQDSVDSDGSRIQAAARRDRRRLEFHSRFPLPCARGRVLCFPECRRHRHGFESAGRLSAVRRQAWPVSTASVSAPKARATCASAMRIRSKTSWKPWSASAGCRRSGLLEPDPFRR